MNGVQQAQGIIKRDSHIFHRVYGAGTVIKITTEQKNARYTIEFDKGSTQRLKKTQAWDISEQIRIPDSEKEEAMSSEAIRGPVCKICGRPVDDDLNECMCCVEEGVTLTEAIMYAKDTKEAMVAWATWRRELRQPKDEFSPELMNCETCHKLMWVPHDKRYLNPLPIEARFCSRECAKKAPQRAR